MCAGNVKRQAHHANEQAKRDAAAAMASQEQAYQAMLRMIPKAPNPQDYTPAPVSTRSTLDDTAGVRSASSRRRSTANTNRGIASLRIPLNTGGSSGGGINIG